MPEPQTGKPQLSKSVEVVGIALTFAVTVTLAGWLWVGKSSPFSRGTFPDVQTSPSVTLWAIANFPAAILFINVFGKNGAEWTYFLCVFLQWLIVGIGIGALVAATRRARKYV